MVGFAAGGWIDVAMSPGEGLFCRPHGLRGFACVAQKG